MNKFWLLMILVGLTMGIATGKGGSELLDAMTSGAQEAIVLCIGLAGTYMFWMGIMEVARSIGAIDGLAKLMKPLLKKLFRGCDDEQLSPITLNLAANFFGMGSAATPFGLEAMKQLQKSNPQPQVATNSMCMFIALNASALELLPMTILAMRAAFGSQSPTSIVVPTFLASVVCSLSAIALCKLFEKKA